MSKSKKKMFSEFDLEQEPHVVLQLSSDCQTVHIKIGQGVSAQQAIWLMSACVRDLVVKEKITEKDALTCFNKYYESLKEV